MYQPTNTKTKDINLGLPPEQPSLEELADEQEPPVMVAGGVIIPVPTLINKSPTADEVPAALVQARASTELSLPATAADEVPTPVQAGVGTELISPAEAAASFVLPAPTADEVPAALVQARASTELSLPATAADEVPTPVRAGLGTESTRPD